ncbi:MAG: tyrosine--tRNA ligase [Calditrichaeota bacterium]|nr:MAG: tyrosine--tRNA ligase [Calditrichota bacterium]
MNLYDELEWRGLVYDATEGAREALAKESLTGYIGFDPTAASLHVGSLMQIMLLARMQRYGHRPIAVVGGGTGLIGDPSGKTTERQLLTKEEVEENLRGIQEQLSRFLDFEAKTNAAIIVNNYDWLGRISFIDFLRDVGKHFSVNVMLSRESVKRRLESEEGISFTEFSYLLLQAYDFLVLYDRYQCRLQMGGSDQWGNIVAGVDLIRRLRGARAYGLVSPLVTTASGVKFGKTEAGTVWLDARLTSPYRFYQFWLNTDDADVITYLKYFTWLSRKEIEALATATQEHPEQREAQRTLAREVTRMVHGETELKRAERASEVLFGGSIEGLGAAEVGEIFQDVPSSAVARAQLEGEGIKLTELLTLSDVAASRGEARRLVQQGGIYLNNRRVTDPFAAVTLKDTIEGQFLVLRKGQKHYHLVKILD